jgi:hypothetical protein
VAAATDLSETLLQDVRAGRRVQIRARTERKILAVSTAHRADHSHVPAKLLWKQIGLLIQEGFSKAQLARQLGYKRALRFNSKTVTARNAERVARLYRRWTT